MPVQEDGYGAAVNAAQDKADQMSGAREGEGQEGGGDNPVADALRVLALFVQAQGAAGNPQAEAMKQALLAFMQSTKGAPAEEQAPPEEVPPEEPAPEEGPMSPGEELANKPKRGRGPQII